MNTRRLPVVALTLAALLVPSLAAQKRVSPHDTISTVIGGGRVTVVYGRPYTKDPRTGEPRKVWGGVVPFGQVWRMGADEATMLVTEKPLTIGDTTVPAGAYTLYMLPAEDGSAKLIVSKQLGQWGTIYKPDMDLAQVEMKKDAVDTAVDQFTMSVAKDATGGMLKASWDKLAYSVAFTVKK